MLGKFFNSFYYGKAGKGDYTPENLPQNRRQLFFETLRVRWSALVRLNLLYVLFFIPAILWTFLNYASIDALLTAEVVGEVIEQGVLDQIYGMLSLYLIILWPLIAITGPATAGVSYIVRNWARDQHSFMLSDFKEAFKANWKQALCISTITGFVPLLAYVGYRYYGYMAGTSSVLFIFPQMLVIILAVLWMLCLELIYSMMVTYELSFRNLIRNAFILAVGKLPLSIGIRLISLALPILGVALLLLVPQITAYVLLVLVVYYLLFGFAFSRFLFASYANAVCEKHINPNIEGAGVGIGLRQVTDDDYEIDPTMPQPKGPGDESET